MTPLNTLAYNYKKANPQASISDFIDYIRSEAQKSEAGKAIAYGFWKALAEAGEPANGDYHFS